MSLTFLGKGNEFNVTDGNTSAYLQQGTSLFLIDCGADVYAKLKETLFFGTLTDIFVLVTHVHADHIGSLASLVKDFYENKARRVTILTPDTVAVTNILACMGIQSSYYLITKMTLGEYEVVVSEDLGDIVLKSYKVNHASNLNSYAYIIRNGGVEMYYSGEASNIPSEVLSALLDGDIDKFYQAVVSFDVVGNIHMSFTVLQDLIVPVDARDKVYVMGYDEDLVLADVTTAGFRTV
jgi:ribonuclease BN (tRNA processing enzyme)